MSRCSGSKRRKLRKLKREMLGLPPLHRSTVDQGQVLQVTRSEIAEKRSLSERRLIDPELCAAEAAVVREELAKLARRRRVG